MLFSESNINKARHGQFFDTWINLSNDVHEFYRRIQSFRFIDEENFFSIAKKLLVFWFYLFGFVLRRIWLIFVKLYPADCIRLVYHNSLLILIDCLHDWIKDFSNKKLDFLAIILELSWTDIRLIINFFLKLFVMSFYYNFKILSVFLLFVWAFAFFHFFERLLRFFRNHNWLGDYFSKFFIQTLDYSRLIGWQMIVYESVRVEKVAQLQIEVVLRF